MRQRKFSSSQPRGGQQSGMCRSEAGAHLPKGAMLWGASACRGPPKHLPPFRGGSFREFCPHFGGAPKWGQSLHWGGLGGTTFDNEWKTKWPPPRRGEAPRGQHFPRVCQGSADEKENKGGATPPKCTAPASRGPAAEQLERMCERVGTPLVGTPRGGHPAFPLGEALGLLGMPQRSCQRPSSDSGPLAPCCTTVPSAPPRGGWGNNVVSAAATSHTARVVAASPRGHRPRVVLLYQQQLGEMFQRKAVLPPCAMLKGAKQACARSKAVRNA